MNTIMSTIMNNTISVLNSLYQVDITGTCYTIYDTLLNNSYGCKREPTI